VSATEFLPVHLTMEVTMGTVIEFRPRLQPEAKPKPAAPPWKRRLWEQWNNPANWETDENGVRRFSSGPRFHAIIYPETEKGYEGYWGFKVFDGPASAAVSEFAWCFDDIAEGAAWEALVELVEKRERVAR
jgi:hypothetical protein